MQRPLFPTPVYAAQGASRPKRGCGDFALWGGKPLFENIRSASNLVQPDADHVFEYLRQSYDQGRLSDGVCVDELEQRLATIHQVKHCVAMCNGLWAIVMCLQALKLPGRSRVVMPSLTYRRLADIAAWVGLTPHFCDVHETSLTATPDTIRPCVDSQTAILLIAHPIVHVCDVEAIEDFAKANGLPLVFDAVEAAHASFNGHMLGGFGDAECYSMHASKFLNAFEAGYITTNNGGLADRLQKLTNPELARQVGADEPLRSFRGSLSELHAAMALASLDDLDAQIDRNRARHELYQTALAHVEGCELVCYADDETRTYKNTLVKLTDQWPLTREQTIRVLHAENLLVRPYYSPPLHQKQTSYPTVFGDLPVTERLATQYLLLPSGEFLSPYDIEPIGQLLQAIQRFGSELAKRF